MMSGALAHQHDKRREIGQTTALALASIWYAPADKQKHELTKKGF